MNASFPGTGLPGPPAHCGQLVDPPRDDFRDSLDEWMEHTPWLLVSLAAHLQLFFVLAAVPWTEIEPPPQPIHLVAEAPEEPPPFTPEPEDPEPIDQAEEPEEPELMRAPEDDTTPSEDPSDDPSDLPLASPFDEVRDALLETGLGGAPPGGSKYSIRSQGGGNGKTGRAMEVALREALAWLAAHQSDDGRWDADGFDASCGMLGTSLCGDAGQAEHDVGVTGLALLAFLGAGNHTGRGEHADTVRRGIVWLRREQDPDTGQIGEPTSREFLYDHAIATLALCEELVFSRSPLTRRTAQRAIRYVEVARNPYGGWRYDEPPCGESDTSVTGWMAFALAAARDAGLEVDLAALAGTLAWIDEATDPASGRVGYDANGSSSSRVAGINDHFPREGAEAMTAVGLLSRIFLGEEPGESPVLEQHADLLLRALPTRHEADRGSNPGPDLYYWYYGTYAMFQMGGFRDEYWRKWERALAPSLLGLQRRHGDERGSWDPSGPWGFAGGRVYSTALAAMCLEVHFRYGRLLGSR